MKKQTINAIQKRLDKGETQFFIGEYFYQCNINGMIRRREQCPGYTPTSDWERVGDWNPATGKVSNE